MCPHCFATIGYSANAVIWNERRSLLGLYLHAALLKLQYARSLNRRSIARSASVNILHARLAEVVLGIVAQPQENCMACSHSI